MEAMAMLFFARNRKGETLLPKKLYPKGELRRAKVDIQRVYAGPVKGVSSQISLKFRAYPSEGESGPALRISLGAR